jgi:hypothetical protein
MPSAIATNANANANSNANAIVETLQATFVECGVMPM